MGKIILSGLAGPQDPMFGFDPRNLVSNLTVRNWRKRAILRSCAGELLYIWITKAECYDDRKARDCYAVHVTTFETDTSQDNLEAQFLHLEDAIRYVNGEVPGTVFAEAWPVPEADWPPARPAVVCVGPLPVSKVTPGILEKVASRQVDSQSYTEDYAGKTSQQQAPDD